MLHEAAHRRLRRGAGGARDLFEVLGFVHPQSDEHRDDQTNRAEQEGIRRPHASNCCSGEGSKSANIPVASIIAMSTPAAGMDVKNPRLARTRLT